MLSQINPVIIIPHFTLHIIHPLKNSPVALHNTINTSRSIIIIIIIIIIISLLSSLHPFYLGTTYRPTPSLQGVIPLNVKHMSLFLLKLLFWGGKPVDSKGARILRSRLHFQYRLNSPRVIKEILLKLVGSLFN